MYRSGSILLCLLAAGSTAEKLAAEESRMHMMLEEGLHEGEAALAAGMEGAENAAKAAADAVAYEVGIYGAAHKQKDLQAAAEQAVVEEAPTFHADAQQNLQSAVFAAERDATKKTSLAAIPPMPRPMAHLLAKGLIANKAVSKPMSRENVEPMVLSSSAAASTVAPDNELFGGFDPKELNDWGVWAAASTLLFLGVFAAAAGIGGGGIVVTTLMLLGGHVLEDAVPLAATLVFAGSLTTYLINLSASGTTSKGSTFHLIDNDYVAVITPMAFLGSQIGILLGRVLQEQTMMYLLVGVLALVTVVTSKKALDQYREEQAACKDTSGGASSAGEGAQSEARSLLDKAADQVSRSGFESIKGYDSAEIDVKSTGKRAAATNALLFLGVFVVVICGMEYYYIQNCQDALSTRLPLEKAAELVPAACQSWGLRILFLSSIAQDATMGEIAKVFFLVFPALPLILIALTNSALLKERDMPATSIGGLWLLAAVGGCASGLLGIGGGLFFSPAFILAGMEAPVAVSTSSLIVLWSAGASACQFFFTNRIHLALALVYSIANIIASFIGTKMVLWIQRTFKGRNSLITLIVVGTLVLSLLGAVLKMENVQIHREVA